MASSNARTVRLTVDLSPELNALLEELARASHTSKSEVLRRSIALMDFAQRAKREGKKVGAATPDQELATEVVGF
ncbi:ribbon-helix-helix protein, CopG family [Truepera radiovictrix]|jgi:predicted transcriptional regulator|uniref:CopG domain protein DNA-binding domain protein n=1 Tax=Truepera radiovictrix (strain DSM 17093 / CIP 108686 / LMG 22925 / RQ-24) TaxID=649638 RepID=D7CWM5_TRURR|nr:ribbon-helix-helix protein, CopG family [Truepera radiovictrix]ADI14424.1 CopG domain protein DNA-binding domain protein [Truepera radiovictrix DSM 17093]WMT57019.1 ribbon-helix-helix protein, CopG family [Truepera radiovictrix]